jgi:hypothetical protein
MVPIMLRLVRRHSIAFGEELIVWSKVGIAIAVLVLSASGGSGKELPKVFQWLGCSATAGANGYGSEVTLVNQSRYLIAKGELIRVFVSSPDLNPNITDGFSIKASSDIHAGASYALHSNIFVTSCRARYNRSALPGPVDAPNVAP